MYVCMIFIVNTGLIFILILNNNFEIFYKINNEKRQY